MKDVKRFTSLNTKACKRRQVFPYISIKNLRGINCFFVSSIESRYKIGLHSFVKIMQRCAPGKIRMSERSRVCNYIRKYSFMPRQGHNCTGMSFPFRLSRNYANSRSNLSTRTRPPLLPRASYNSCMSKSLVIILPVRMKIIHRMYTKIDARNYLFYPFYQISEI